MPYSCLLVLQRDKFNISEMLHGKEITIEKSRLNAINIFSRVFWVGV